MRLCVAIASFVIVNGFVVPTGRAPRARTHVTTLSDSGNGKYADLVAAYKKVKSVVDPTSSSDSVTKTVKGVTKSVEEVTKSVKPAVDEVAKTVKPAVDEVAKTVGPAVEKVKPQYEPLAPGKVPSLFEFAAGRTQSGVDAGPGFDRLANAKEKLEMIKSNFFTMENDFNAATVSNPAVSSKLSIIKENAVGLKSTLDASSDAVMQNLPTDQASVLMKNLASGGTGLADIWSSLKIEEYGGWYVAALAVAASLTQRNAGKEDAARDFSSQLDGAKSQASSAAEAASLAAEGAKLASAAASRARTSSSTAVLEATRSKAARVENKMLQKKLDKLQKQVDAAKSAKAENAKLKKEITKLKKAAKKADKLLLENKELAEQIAILKKGGASSKAPPKAKVASPKAKVAVKAKAKIKRAVKKKATKTADDNEDMFFATKDSKPGPKGSKSSAPNSSPVDVTTSENPWGSLAVSTLKRKTVQDLRAYLSERGVNTKGDDGKLLKKDLLVKAVQNL